MINMLIVDDELLMRRGLSFIPWEKAGVCLIGTASSGMEALERSKGFIRSLLAKRLTIRKCPELHFILDTSLEYGNKIETIIEELKEK